MKRIRDSLLQTAADLLRIFALRDHRKPSAHRTMTTIIAALLVIAVSVGLPAPADLLAQDYPADVSRGKAIYERHCLTCHGQRGFGDGPSALLLTIAPANFHRPGSFLKSDETLLRMIEHGGVFSPMHSWRGRLTDGEMQDVLAYIRALSQDSR
jgi:mono/diheme cytochrome c family protein